MVIFGIDPGYDRVGYGILEINNRQCEVLSYGLISTSKQKHFDERILEIGNDLTQLLESYKPQHLFIEKLYMGRNTTTVLYVSEVRGMIRYLTVKQEISLTELAPNTIKKNITGYGAADKNQMTRAITALLHLSEPPRPDDVADALAIAFCGYLKLS